MTRVEYSRLWRADNPELNDEYNRRAYEKRRKPGARRNKKVNPEFPWARKLLWEARSSSKDRGHPQPSIDEDWIISKFHEQEGRCHWTGVELDPSDGQLKPSLDRLDNSRGYDADNIVISCWFINRARGSLSTVAFSKILKLIVESASNAH